MVVNKTNGLLGLEAGGCVYRPVGFNVLVWLLVWMLRCGASTSMVGGQ